MPTGVQFTQREAEVQLAEVMLETKVPLQAFSTGFLSQGGADIPDWADTYRKRMEFDSGRAVVGTDRTTDIPKVGITVAEEVGDVRMILVKGDYGFMEERRSNAAGRPLAASTARAMLRACMETHDDIAWNGSPAHKLAGALNLIGIPRYYMTEPISSSASSQEALLTQILKVLLARRSNTNLALDMHTAFGMTETHYQYLATTYRTGRDFTLLEYLKRAYPNVTWETFNQLAGKGDAGGDLTVAFDPSARDMIDYVIPGGVGNAVRPLPPFQVSSTVTEVVYYGMTGGVRSYKPMEAITIGVPLGS